MTLEQARALFLEHCQPGDRGTLERHGEKAAVAAIMALSPTPGERGGLKLAPSSREQVESAWADLGDHLGHEAAAIGTPSDAPGERASDAGDATDALTLADEYVTKRDWNGAYHAMRAAYDAVASPVPGGDVGQADSAYHGACGTPDLPQPSEAATRLALTANADTFPIDTYGLAIWLDRALSALPSAIAEGSGDTQGGTFACPICGDDKPHHHTPAVVDAYQNKRSRT